MAIRSRPEVFSGLRGRRRRVPAERAGCAGGARFAAREDRDRFGAEDGGSFAEHGVSETGQVLGGGEEAGVSGNPAEDTGVFVLYLALDDAVAKRAAGAWPAAARVRWCRPLFTGPC